MKIKAEARSVEEQIVEKREFYDNEQRNNNERQTHMSMAERQAVKLRTQYEDAEKNRLSYENEVHKSISPHHYCFLRFFSCLVYDVWSNELKKIKKQHMHFLVK